jgi:hypothetical protein
MKLIILSILFLSSLSSDWAFSEQIKLELDESTESFLNWIQQNRVNYLSVEEMEFRKKIFDENKAYADHLNQNENQTA